MCLQINLIPFTLVRKQLVVITTTIVTITTLVWGWQSYPSIKKHFSLIPIHLCQKNYPERSHCCLYQFLKPSLNYFLNCFHNLLHLFLKDLKLAYSLQLMPQSLAKVTVNHSIFMLKASSLILIHSFWQIYPIQSNYFQFTIKLMHQISLRYFELKYQILGKHSNYLDFVDENYLWRYWFIFLTVSPNS